MVESEVSLKTEAREVRELLHDRAPSNRVAGSMRDKEELEFA